MYHARTEFRYGVNRHYYLRKANNIKLYGKIFTSVIDMQPGP